MVPDILMIRNMQLSPYFNSLSTRHYQDFKPRPTMALAATTLSEAKGLIDRGIDADSSFPEGTAYLLSTSDAPAMYAQLYFQNGEFFSPLYKHQNVKARHAAQCQ